jgi:glycosyltransferase involved in cell wall biosynthesis
LGKKPVSGFRVLLVGNYAPDAQPSMHRFAALLCEGLTARGVSATVLRPPVVFGRHSANLRGVAKWVGYTDKFLLFPHRLRKSLGLESTDTVVHICDHSNAVYVPWIRHLPHVVTCHDLLAVRAARSEFEDVRTRWSGRQLQRAIVHGLRRASRIVCDSQATRSDLVRVTGSADRGMATIYPAVSPCFTKISPESAVDRAKSLLIQARAVGDRTTGAIEAGRYILHVGGNQWYKNRSGLVAIYAALVEADVHVPPLLLAGKPIPPELREEILNRQLGGRVFEVADIADPDLAALYACARLLLFPSLAEGFGWPVLEAMACGCRVVVSDRAPLTEVAADAATYIEPEEPVRAASQVRAVLDESEDGRAVKVRAGLNRASGFTLDGMAGAYLDVYRGLLASS